MTQPTAITKTLVDKSKGYKRTKTISYTLTEYVQPLQNKRVQLSFPFPEDTKITPISKK